MGSFPHELSGYRHVSDATTRATVRGAVGPHASRPSPACASPTCSTPRSTATSRACSCRARTSPRATRTRCTSCTRSTSLELVIVQDLFINETAKVAHVFLPGTSFLEKDGTFTNAERRINRVRPAMRPRNGKQEWEVVCELATALGAPMHYDNAAQIMDEIAALTPTFAGVSFAKLDEVGSVQWPCNDAHAAGHADHARGHVRAWPRPVHASRRTCPPTRRAPAASRCCSPPAASSASTTWARRPGAPRTCSGTARTCSRSTRPTPRSAASATATRSRWPAASAPPRCTRVVSDRMAQGVVYTTFHYPVSGANVVTTEHSDWATNCPEYKVTAVQVSPGHSAATVEIDHPEHRLGALVRMANQIARQMAADPNADAVAATATHLGKFWEPDMRADLAAAIDGGTVTARRRRGAGHAPASPSTSRVTSEAQRRARRSRRRRLAPAERSPRAFRCMRRRGPCTPTAARATPPGRAPERRRRSRPGSAPRGSPRSPGPDGRPARRRGVGGRRSCAR